MIPVKTPECNFTYTAPSGIKNCGDLPCLRQDSGTTSFWQPDPDELAHLAAGGTVAFTHYGKGHPVVGLGVMPAPKSSDANEDAWRRAFVTPIAKVMRSRGIRSMTLRFTDEETLEFFMRPEADKSAG